MRSTVLTEHLTLPEVSRREVFRYALSGGDEALLDECLGELKSTFAARVCYAVFDTSVDGGECCFGEFSVKSHDLAKNLGTCSRTIIFAATVGVEYDRLIMKYSRLSPVKALFFQAIGSERVETLCDVFLKKQGEGRALRPRFSAGYGDLPLEVQKDIFSLLGVEKNIGVSLNSSLLMTPTKSVTAFVGIGKNYEF